MATRTRLSGMQYAQITEISLLMGRFLAFLPSQGLGNGRYVVHTLTLHNDALAEWLTIEDDDNSRRAFLHLCDAFHTLLDQLQADGLYDHVQRRALFEWVNVVEARLDAGKAILGGKNHE